MRADNQSGGENASQQDGHALASVATSAAGGSALSSDNTHQNYAGHVTGTSLAPAPETGRALTGEVLSFEPKWFVRSKTILGAVVGLLPHVLAGLGLSFDDGEVQNLATTGSAFLAAILVVWGRATASRPLSALPQKASEFVGSAVICGAVGSLALQGCATRVNGADGKPQLVTFGDARGLHFRGPGTSLDVDELNHSTPTKAGMNGATSLITAAGAAVATGGAR